MRLQHAVVPTHDRRGGHFGEPPINNAPVGHEAEFEILSERGFVDLSRPSPSSQGTRRGSKCHTAVCRGVHEWFHAESIADEIQLPRPVVPQRERKHAAEA